MRKYLYPFLFLTLLSISAQTSAGKFGFLLSTSSNSQNSFGFSIWASESFSLEPTVGIRYVNVEDNSATAWGLGLGLLVHFSMNVEQFSPYFAGRIEANGISTEDDSATDFAVSLGVGGEYFFAKWFSTGGEFRFAIVKTDEDFSPSRDVANATFFETQQAIFLRVYFN